MIQVVISNVLCNIFVVCACVMILSWAAVAIQMTISDYKQDKREQEKFQKDKEDHEKRMESYR